VDEEIDASLGAVMGLRAALIRADRLDALVELTRRSADLVAPSRIEWTRWAAGRLEIGFAAEIRHRDGRPFAFARRDTQTVLDPDFTRDIAAELIDVSDDLRPVRLGVTIRDEMTSVEWRASTKVTVVPKDLEPGADGRDRVRVVFQGVATLNPELAAGDQPLPPGVWEWRTRLEVFGLGLEALLGAATTADADIATLRPYFHADHLVTLTVTPGSGATLAVAEAAEPPRGRSVYRPRTGTIWRAEMTVARAARRVHRRLPAPLRDRSAAAVRAVRSIVR
jgi:hypothetical protein